MDVTIFAELYAKCYHHFKEGGYFIHHGEKCQQMRKTHFICESVHEQRNFPALFEKMQFCIKISRQGWRYAKLQALDQILAGISKENGIDIIPDGRQEICTMQPENFCRCFRKDVSSIVSNFSSGKSGLDYGDISQFLAKISSYDIFLSKKS